MSTILDVAKQAGVSAMTVSRYFNQPERLATATSERVRAAIEELQYVPNAAARSLISGRTRTIALILSDIANPFYTTIGRGVEDIAQKHNYTLILGNTDESLAKERRYIDIMISRCVDGVIISSSSGNEHHLELLSKRSIPIVLIDRTVKGFDADAVTGDTFTGGQLLTRHMIEQGYTKIALIGGWSGVSSLDERLAGYRKAMQIAGLEPSVHPGRTDRQSGEEITMRLFAENMMPEAIIAANNYVAVGAMVALRHLGLRVPSDIALATFDDIESAALIHPFLTVVAQPAYQMGSRAMEMLLERINGYAGPTRKEVLPTEMIIRTSSGAPVPDVH